MLIGKRPRTRGIRGVLALIFAAKYLVSGTKLYEGIRRAVEKVVADRP
jgi:predicted DsbA family dithiol-disulfide isomerase